MAEVYPPRSAKDGYLVRLSIRYLRGFGNQLWGMTIYPVVDVSKMGQVPREI
jgi:hypothetical protein